MKKHIPNTLTSFNLVCGCIGIGMAIKGNLPVASYMIFLAAAFDFLDGFVARMLKVNSLFGKELDSLADLVSFGVLPGVMVFIMLNNCVDENAVYMQYVAFVPFLIPVFSGLRLAKFNNDETQKDCFVGMPTPANGLLFASLPLIFLYQSDEFLFLTRPLSNPAVLVFLSIFMSVLLVSPVKLFALKFKSFSIKGNELKYLLILLSAILLIVMQYVAIPIILVLYIVLSLIQNFNKS